MSNKALLLTSPAPSPSYTLTSRPIPTPGPNQVVIQNSTIALNPSNHKLTTIPGFAAAVGLASFPVINGNDVAGRIHSVGPNVPHSQAHVGQPVLALTSPHFGLDYGAFQEYTLVDLQFVAAVPTRHTDGPTSEPCEDLREAATLPTAAVTAAGLLRDAGVDLKGTSTASPGAGAAILVWGASGSVGSTLVQFARNLGYIVFATCSPRSKARVEALGAHKVFDYNDPTDALVAAIQGAERRRGVKVGVFVDANSADMLATAKVVGALGGGKLLTTVPWQMALAGVVAPDGVEVVFSGSGSVVQDKDLVGHVMKNLVEKWLADGRLKGTKVQVVDGWIDGIEAGIEQLKQGVSGVKLVVDHRHFVSTQQKK